MIEQRIRLAYDLNLCYCWCGFLRAEKVLSPWPSKGIIPKYKCYWCFKLHFFFRFRGVVVVVVTFFHISSVIIIIIRRHVDISLLLIT